MPTSLNTTLPEVQTLAMQLPADERWALLKTLIESLQPESPAPQFTEILSVTSNHHSLLLQMAQDPEIQAELVAIDREFEVTQMDGITIS
jgi:hypothetical protein